MSTAGGVRVTTPTDRQIVLTRGFAAPRRLVFDALTTPELLRRWYGARGWNLIDCEVDLRVGGRWRFLSRGPGGETMGQSGRYQEVDPPGLLVLTELFDDQSYPGESLVTHRLVETGGSTAPTTTAPTTTAPTPATTTLTTTLLFATPQGRDTVLRYPMARGVGEGYARLDEVLRTAVPATPDPPTPPPGGVPRSHPLRSSP